MMKIKTTKAQQNFTPENNFKLRPIAALCAVLFITPAGVAMAQTTTASPTDAVTNGAVAAPLQTVVVSGIRTGIEGAITLKKNSDSIVEAISQEDIGKLPDASIADALSRLPGVAGQRVDGREQVIAIRGMSPDFTGTLLNDREQASTGGNRGVEYDQYPAELISSAVVYKTPDASLLGQGLAGTVDLHTVNPLDYSEQKMVMGVRGEKNSLGNLNHGYGGTSDLGGRFSFSYIDQFDDHKLGIAIGYAHLDAPGQEEHEKAWWWGAPGPGFYNGATAMGGNEITATSRKEIRDGLIGVVEYKPNSDIHSTVDAYYSTFNQTEVMRGVMWDSNPWTSNYTYTNPGFAQAGGATILNSGVLSFAPGGNQPVVRNDYNTRKDTLASLGWKNEVKVNDWRLISDLSYSSAKRNENLFETYAGSTTNSIAFNIPTTSGFGVFTPSDSFADPNTQALGDPGGWGHDGRYQTTTQNDVIKAMNLHATHPLTGFFSKVDFGINLSERDKTQNFLVDFATLKNGAKSELISSSNLMTPTSLAFAGAGNVLSYDVNNIANQYYTMTQNMSGGPSGDYSHDFGVHERVTTAYIKADIDTELGHIPVRGNLGAQLINTNQYSNAWAFAANGQPSVPFENGVRYGDFLPSLNLVGDIGDDRLVRFGLARTLARPRIDDMNASNSAGVSTTTHLWSGGGGNPTLRPWIADGVDLSLEQYWGKRSYLSGALFFKKLDSYIYQQNIPFNFSGYVNSTPTVVPISNIGTYSTQANGSGGNMKGIELSASLTGDLLTPALSNFGILTSASMTDTSIMVNGPGANSSGQLNTPMWATLPGLSKYVADMTVYYEKNGFSARISDRYRSSFRGEYASLFGATSVMRSLGQSIVDMQISYELQQGSYKGMSFMLQVANLTNTADRNVQDGSGFGGATAPQETNKYGTGYLLGMTYKFK